MSIWETSSSDTTVYKHSKCQNQIRVWNAKISVTAYLEFYFSRCSENSGSVLFKNVLLQNAMYKSNPSFQSKILTNVKVLKIQIILHGTKIFWCDKKTSFFGPVLFYPTFSISYCWHMSWLHHISKYVLIKW